MESAATVLLLAQWCSPAIEPTTARAVVSVESAFNPYAIGVVGGHLTRQPRSRAEALATIQVLEEGGWSYSVGLAQINNRNFARLGLTAAAALDGCTNLAAMETILFECFARARPSHPDSQAALRAALSCYYSGNFVTGFKHRYVDKVVRGARELADASKPNPSQSQTLARAERGSHRTDAELPENANEK